MINTNFMLMYSEVLYNMIQSEYKEKIRMALDACWSFVDTQSVTGEELYYLLDDGTDFGGIFIYMQLDENEINIPIWDNISYAIAAVSKEAFTLEEIELLPSPLENIDDELLNIFITNLREIDLALFNVVDDVKQFLIDTPNISKKIALEELKLLQIL